MTDSENEIDAYYVAQETGLLVEKCEQTGNFDSRKFGSRHFYEHGEYQLAFNGIYRFTEGNHEFRDTMPESYFVLLKLYQNEEYGPNTTTIHKWAY